MDFEDDMFEDITAEEDFVGRERDLNLLRNAWQSNKIFGIFGIRSVGKSRLAKEFVKEMQTCMVRPNSNGVTLSEGHRTSACNFTEIRVNVRYQESIDTLHANVCARLGVVPEQNATQTTRWIDQIIGILRSRHQEKFIIVLDNAENVVDGPLQSTSSLVAGIAKGCRNCKIVITSTTRIQFAQIRKVYFSHELLPLPPTEAKSLLKVVAPDVDLGEHEAAIVTLSEGLPLLILMIGAEFMEDPGLITPPIMIELLTRCRLRTLSREFYPEEDRIADVYKAFIERLSPVFQQRLKVLEYMPGSFNVYEAKDMLGHETDAQTVDQTIIPIRRRHMLTYDHVNRRFNIQGILRECLQVYYTTRNLPEIRERYCKSFCSVMQDVSNKLSTDEYTRAICEFAKEQPNLQKLLKEVVHTKEDTYKFFIKVAEGCTTLIEQFMADESDRFYNSCLQLTDQYGTPEDKAVVHIAKGSLCTNVRGELKGGEENYRLALQIVAKKDDSLLLATVYQRLGWNLKLNGKSEEAVVLFRKSLDISKYSSRKEFRDLALQSSSSLGITNTMLGNFEDAELYHFQTLNRRKALLGSDHPFIGASYNNIGIMYDQKGEPEEAVQYFTEGLAIKQKAHAAPLSIVYSLNNIAAQYNILKEYDKSHRYLDEAMAIMRAENWRFKDGLGLTYDTRGKVFHSEKKFDEAADMFEEAVSLRQENAPEDITVMESLVHLAQSNKCRHKYSKAASVARKAIDLEGKAIKAMPQNTFIAECLECLADIQEATGDISAYQDTLARIRSELVRLEYFNVSHCNERKVINIRNQLKEVNAKLKTTSEKILNTHNDMNKDAG